jgi:hypothetical protein
MQSQLLGQINFCWATKIVILGSPADNCSKNAMCFNSSQIAEACWYRMKLTFYSLNFYYFIGIGLLLLLGIERLPLLDIGCMLLLGIGRLPLIYHIPSYLQNIIPVEEFVSEI